MRYQLALMFLAGTRAVHGAYNHLHLALATLNTESVPSEKFKLPVDHFGGTPGTFQNRWWYNDTFYEAGGPVFIMDGGEGNGEDMALSLYEGPGQKTNGVQLAKKYKGLAIVWEHRYYGESVPFVQNRTVKSIADLDGRQWSFHTVDQALEDVVVFANTFKLPSSAGAASKLKSPDALQASKTPWIFIGGSYPGMRAGMLRVRNPETIFASWASSAPVQAQIDMRSYYRQVARGLSVDCRQPFATAISFFDSIMLSGSARQISLVKNDLAQAFQGSDRTVASSVSDAESPLDFANELTGVFSSWQDVGPAGLKGLCTSFEAGQLDSGDRVRLPSATPEQTLGSLANAIERTTNRENANDPKVLTPSVNATGITTFRKIKHVGIIHRREEADIDPDTRSWMWQYCSQMGFFQIGDPDSKENVVSTLVDLAVFQDECKATFPGMIPAAPKVDEVLKYGGWAMNPTRVFFSNGEHDPWRTLSVDSSEPGAPQRKPTSIIPAFDAAPAASSYFGVVYPGQVHVPDFFWDVSLSTGEKDAFETGMKMFSDALDVWLPHFTPGGGEKSKGGQTGSGSGSGNTSDSDKKDSGATGISSSFTVTSLALAVLVVTVFF